MSKETVFDRELRPIVEREVMSNPAPRPRDPARPADRVVFWVCACIALTLIYSAVYQHGYDTGREACRAPVRQEIKPMTHKHKVKVAQWFNRDMGAIR